MTPFTLFVLTTAVVLAIGSFKIEKKDLVCLMADEDGKVGKVYVKTEKGEVVIDKNKYFVTIDKDKISEPTLMSDEEFSKRYSNLLNMEPLKPKSFLLYFLAGSDNLTEESLANVQDLLKEIKSRKDPEILIIGHTDSLGSKEVNYNLGLKRAESVKHIILSSGVLETTPIEILSHGEDDPLIPLPDETSEPKNRRVEIIIK
ncbi:MAG: OmpA family protein [Calditerrivibrio sp.]|nr:OmpA family protein [Calditerrivibrio sp.]